jgi:hypothetical protein
MAVEPEGLGQRLAGQGVSPRTDAFQVQAAAFLLDVVVLQRVDIGAEEAQHVAVALISGPIFVAGAVECIQSHGLYNAGPDECAHGRLGAGATRGRPRAGRPAAGSRPDGRWPGREEPLP